ncbi:MAG: hypothetical protein KY458_11410 [Actinobacteria bacterium]|nr:hypothetical protein [Actinomycetota bacterium]
MTPRPEVEVWLTTADQTHLLERRDDVILGAHGAPVTITVDDHRERQRMQGFGASFTESAAVLVHDRLGPGRRDELMRRLFDPEAWHRAQSPPPTHGRQRLRRRQLHLRRRARR